MNDCIVECVTIKNFDFWIWFFSLYLYVFSLTVKNRKKSAFYSVQQSISLFLVYFIVDFMNFLKEKLVFFSLCIVVHWKSHISSTTQNHLCVLKCVLVCFYFDLFHFDVFNQHFFLSFFHSLHNFMDLRNRFISFVCIGFQFLNKFMN